MSGNSNKDNDIFEFELGFKGQLVENSVDAFDVANTILALSTAITQICEINYGEGNEAIKVNINAFKKGSLITDFLVYVKDGLPYSPIPIFDGKKALDIGKNILDTIKVFVEVKTLLKGNKPKSVKSVGDKLIQIIAEDNSNVNITINQYKSLQDKTIAKNLEKAFLPLTVEGNEIESIEIATNDIKDFETIKIDQANSRFMKTNEDSQNLPNMKHRGYISKMDTKTRSGYLTIGQKRVPFNYPKTLHNIEFELLVQSLKEKMLIYLVGDTEMDFEANPKFITAKTISTDKDLFN